MILIVNANDIEQTRNLIISLLLRKNYVEQHLKDSLSMLERKIVIFLISIVMFSCSTENNESQNTIENTVVNDNTAVVESTIIDMDNIGIGPIKSLFLEDIDQDMLAKGKEIFNIKCVACHQIGVKLIGPDLTGVTKRRNPAWIINMILNPEEMMAKDPIAKSSKVKYLAPMINLSLTEQEARSILEYLREVN